MSLTRSIAPAELPISLDELKDHLRLTDDTSNADLMGYLRGVVGGLDGAGGGLNRALITQSWVLKFRAFPRGVIRLPLPPAQSVTSVQYIDTANVTQTLAASKYNLLNADTEHNPGEIEIDAASGETWPSTRAVGEAVTVSFVCGYGLRNDVPENTRTVIKLLAADAFRQREPYTAGALMQTPSFKAMFDLAKYHGVA